MDITTELQKPDYQVLKWGKEDAGVHPSSHTSKGKIIGAPLEAGYHLYQDLQKTYCN